MVFENDLQAELTVRDQIVSHLPIALIAIGVMATMVALHTAIAGVALAGLAHAAIGVVLLAVRQRRERKARSSTTRVGS